VNQLHALLRELMAGGTPTSLTPSSATTALRGFRAHTALDRIRLELAKELIADVRRFDKQLKANAVQVAVLLDEHRTRLRELDGIGPVLAGPPVGPHRPPGRFPTEAAYANHTALPPCRSPAPTAISIGCPGTETVSSTPRSTASRHARRRNPRRPCTIDRNPKCLLTRHPERRQPNRVPPAIRQLL
jgi:hypothetical protein